MTSSPSIVRWRSGLHSSLSSRPRRQDITSYMLSPTPSTRSGRFPPNVGTMNGSGFTRCGASFTSSERSSSASRTSPRSKFWR
jgi:hypothetical protein